MKCKEFDILDVAIFCKIEKEDINNLANLLEKVSPIEIASLKLLIDTSTSLAYESGCAQATQERNAESWSRAIEEEDRLKSLKFF